MSEEANIPSGPGDDDALAAEYVLGVLDQAEREQAASRIARDAAFARRVAAWEARFSGLNEDFAEVPPPASVKAALDRRLFGANENPGPATVRTGLWNSLAFWRLVSGAAIVGLIALAFVTLRSPEVASPTEDLVAYLAAQNSQAQFIVLYDSAADRLRVTPIAGEKPSDKDYELWLIAGEDPAVSLGLVGHTGEKAPSVSDALKTKFHAGVTLAVSLEPEGGSPTGQATGPVIALGPAKKI